ncbi:MAG TPA: hypothetical protein VJK49_08250 [Candidatus Limnocylindrales bacterium]|nr:hypothetical protein [Candidatus Limnocylindrales bacterium]
MLEGLVALDYLLLRTGRYPALYEAGIRYKRQNDPHRWASVHEVMAAGYADCKNLSAWRAAEFRLQGIPARVIARPSSRTTWHAIVLLPDGRTEDPSALLGMRRRRR